MRLGKRRRVEELPFAGIHDVTADTEPAIFAIYGVSATLHPLDQSNDDEGAELVPWPEDSSDPVLVDRFDCRLLLDPSELIDTSAAGRSRQRKGGEAASSSTDNLVAATEAELEEQRWRDLFHPPHLQQYEYYVSENDEEEIEREKRTHGAAIPFTYLNAANDTAEAIDGNRQRERVYYLEDLEPPPPPLYLHTHDNQSKFPLVTLLKSSGGSSSNSSSNNTCASKLRTDLFRFVSQQYGIMQRTAEFLHMCQDHGGTEILFERAFNDPTFAFLSPDHVWNDFFIELLEKMEPLVLAEEIQTEKQQQEEKEENCLGELLGGYGSEEEKVQHEEDEEQQEEKIEKKKEEADCDGQQQKVIKAIIARLIESTTQNNGSTSTTNHIMASLVKKRLYTDPLIASIVNPEGPFFNIFAKEIEGAVGTGTMNDDTAAIWLGNSINTDTVSAVMKGEEKIEEGRKKVEPAAVPAPATKGISLIKEKQSGKPTTASLEIDEIKKEERKKKARLLLERQRQVAEERRQGQAVAQKHAEEERNQHLAAISVHKRMFLDNSDDE